MIDQNQANFPPRRSARAGQRPLPRGQDGIIAGSAVLFVVGAVAVMGASPGPSASTGADPSSAPEFRLRRTLHRRRVQVADPAPSADPGTQPPPARTAPRSRPDG